MSLIKRFKRHTIRIGAVQIVVGAVFIYLLCGLFYRQVIQHDHFSKRERQQSTRRIIVPAVRGNIYDRNGDLLVGNRPIFSLELYLSECKAQFREEFINRAKKYAERSENFSRKALHFEVRKEILDKILSPIEKLLNRDLSLSEKQIDRQLAQRSLLPITLINELTIEEYDKLINYLPANSPVQIRASSTRFYPHNQLACHVLGYTVLEESNKKYDDHIHTFSVRQQKGKSGVEMAADDALRGSNGEEIWQVFPSGEKRNLEYKLGTQNGSDVSLSIDRKLQKTAEEALSQYVGSVIVMDARTGEVLVLANSPAYDPNTLYPSISKDVFDEITERSAWFNQAMQGLFPPGSIFKLLSAITFFESEDFDPDEKWTCNGIYVVRNRRFRCHNHAFGQEMNLHLALAKSCNTYVFEHAARVGGEKIAQEAKTYHLDHPTGIDLPFETHGMVISDPAWKGEHGFGGWSTGDTLNLSIGQGYILVTPLSICCFTCALAKNVQRVVPTIFHKTEGEISSQKQVDEPFLPAEKYYYLVDAMVDCVEKYTGSRARVDGVAVAGKTGSAQFKEHGERRNIAWFTCFAPAYDPEIAITVMVREDRDGQNYHGGAQAAPIARTILKKYFSPGGASAAVENR